MRGVLIDTQGPEIRTGNVEDGGKITMVQGSTIELTTNPVRSQAGVPAASLPCMAGDPLSQLSCFVFSSKLIGRATAVPPSFCSALCCASQAFRASGLVEDAYLWLGCVCCG